MATRNKSEQTIRRVQLTRRTKEVATQTACAENARGYYSEYGSSWFNNRENNAFCIYRSYNDCYLTSSEPVIDEKGEY